MNIALKEFGPKSAHIWYIRRLLIILLAALGLAIFTRVPVRKSNIELFRILTALVCRSKKSLIDILFAHV